MARFRFTMPAIVEEIHPESGAVIGEPVRIEVEMTGSAENLREASIGFRERLQHTLTSADTGVSAGQTKEVEEKYGKNVIELISQVDACLAQSKKIPVHDPGRLQTLKAITDIMILVKDL